MIEAQTMTPVKSNASAGKAWLRALELTAPIARNPERVLSTVIEELAVQWGETPVAFVVPKPGAAPSEDALRRFALDNGPAYAHPRAVWFVPELPLAGTNKIDRKTLVERAARQFVRDEKRI